MIPFLCRSHLGALNLMTWVMLLIIGFALIFLPVLGTQIVASNGETPTAPYRLLEVLGALIGFSVLTASSPTGCQSTAP